MRPIKIKTTEVKFYRQFLELFRSLPPFSKLRPRELDVLSELLYRNNLNKKIEKPTRPLVIFSTKVRKEMRDALDISEDIFNNNLSGLRKHKLIDDDNRLIPFLENLYFNKEFDLHFKFYK